MEQNNLVLVIAVLAVLVALANAVIVFQKVDDIQRIVGYATETGTANLTIQSNLDINFSDNIIDWGSGTHVSDVDNATLVSNGTVSQGNWSIEDSGLMLENIGNTNASIELSTGKDADGFIGGDDAGGPVYEWRISENETGTCSGTLSDTSFTAVSTSPKTVCTNMGSSSDVNELIVDIKVVIPIDAPKEPKGDVITATATSVL